MRRPYLIGWIALVALGVGCAFAIDVGRLAGVILNSAKSPFAPDFTVFWTAPQIAVHDIYDTVEMTKAQASLTDGGTSPRPWVYPPTFLLWMRPFSALPLWLSYVAWNLLGLGVFLSAAWRMLGPRAWLTLLSVPVFFAILMGQTSLLLGGLIVWGTILLPSRPRLAGALFGLAATIKPQAVMMVPLAMWAGGYIVSLGWSASVGLAVGSLALAHYGLQPWLDWLTAVSGFIALVREMGILHRSITPTGMIESCSVTGAAAGAILVASGLCGVSIVWRSFKSDGLAERIAAVTLGSLLCSPYALEYEPTALSVAAISMLSERRQVPVQWLGAAFGFATLGGWFSTAIFSIVIALQGKRAPSSDE